MTPWTYRSRPVTDDPVAGTDRTPWIVVRYGPDVPPRTYRLACLRCGDNHDTALPLGVTEIVRIGEGFTRRHRGCREEGTDAR